MKGLIILNKYINLKIRVNPYTISAAVSAVLTALRISPSSLTSWSVVYEELVQLVGNPFLLVTTIITVLGIIHDPTTKGFLDCNQVLEFDKPQSKSI